MKIFSPASVGLFFIFEESEVLQTSLKQKSIPIFFTEKRKAFHWITKINLANYILDTSRTTQHRYNYQKKP